ncbi:MAG: trehalose-phosphatase [Desulfobacterales bacterium]|nr:trehalose-phosphatase [Desulfobacterales bacterium]
MEDPRLCSLETFWQPLQTAKQRVLLLDYDGTLAPFRQKRDKAFPYPGVSEILEKIQQSGKTRLIIVSGRNIKDVISLLGLEQLPEIWGGHGFERLLPDTTLQRKKIPATCSLNLQKAFLWARKHGYENNCEQKTSSLAFHWRGLKEEIKEQLQKKVGTAWKPLTEGQRLEIHPFDGGLELRCAGIDKGDTIKQILDECAQDTIIAYLGDDLTDEDAFKALKGKGLSVLVRDTHRETLADCWLTPPDELLDFLHNWYRYSIKI